MDFAILVKGIIMGFCIALPVGPIAILCTNRSLVEGKLAGFLTGMGAATADAVYGCIAAFGLTLISGFLLDYKDFIQFIGIIFLFYLGIKMFFEKIVIKLDYSPDKKRLGKYYISTFFLTLTNPMTIISFTMVFSGLGFVSEKHDYISAISLILGVFLGSALWWIILTNLVIIVGKKINNKFIAQINKISGLIIIFFALYLIFS